MISMKPVGLGIVGCGNVLDAYVRLAWQLEQQDAARITLLCGRESQRARAGDLVPDVPFVTDDGSLIESPDVDAVIILTPITTHATLAKRALLAGKHVLLEKPLATDIHDARELVDLARCGSALLICAPFTCLSPTFRKIGGHLQQADIGTVVSARGRYGWSGPDWSAWFYRRGGGAIFDLAVYNITTLTGWLGPVERVCAVVGTAIPHREIEGKRIEVEVDDNAHIVLDFGQARMAVITTGFTIQQYRGPGLELYGTEGTLQMLGDDWDPQGYEMWRNSAGCWQCYNESDPDWPWADGLRELVESIQTGRVPRLAIEHAFHVLEIMLAAQQSGRTGQFVDVQSTFPRFVFDGPAQMEGAHRIHDRTR